MRRGLSDSETIPIQLGLHEVAGDRTQGEFELRVQRKAVEIPLQIQLRRKSLSNAAL